MGCFMRRLNVHFCAYPDIVCGTLYGINPVLIDIIRES